jgi:hypothetical protein
MSWSRQRRGKLQIEKETTNCTNLHEISIKYASEAKQILTTDETDGNRWLLGKLKSTKLFPHALPVTNHRKHGIHRNILIIMQQNNYFDCYR